MQSSRPRGCINASHGSRGHAACPTELPILELPILVWLGIAFNSIIEYDAHYCHIVLAYVISLDGCRSM